jgi:hypothetical protein
MKITSATLVSIALMACSASAEDAYQSTMSGNVTIQVVPQEPATGEPQPQAAQTLTVRFVPPPKPAQKTAEEDQDDPQVKLKLCGERWNVKLADYEARLPKLEKYDAYYRKWQNYPAQHAPKSGDPILTRASYRACMYACLGDAAAECPGGWPAKKK